MGSKVPTCPKCGRELRQEGLSFCPFCGSPLQLPTPRARAPTRGSLIIILICLLAIGVLYLTIGMRAFFVDIGLFFFAITVVVRKYRPQSVAVVAFFEVPTWVAMLVSGVFFIAIGVLFIIPL
jgi:hypothetical protein